MLKSIPIRPGVKKVARQRLQRVECQRQQHDGTDNVNSFPMGAACVAVNINDKGTLHGNISYITRSPDGGL